MRQTVDEPSVLKYEMVAQTVRPCNQLCSRPTGLHPKAPIEWNKVLSRLLSTGRRFIREYRHALIAQQMMSVPGCGSARVLKVEAAKARRRGLALDSERR